MFNQENLDKEYNTNNSVELTFPIKKHFSSSNIVTSADYKSKNPIFRNAKKERESAAKSISTEAGEDTKNSSSKDIARLMKELKVEEKNMFKEKAEDSDSDDSLEGIKKAAIQKKNTVTFSSFTVKKMFNKINDWREGPLRPAQSIIEDENEDSLIEKDEIEENFLEFYLDIHFNTEDNYEGYVYSCLKASYFFPKNMNWDEEIKSRELFLPPTTKRKTIFLDLDETLIHTDLEKQYGRCDVELRLDNQPLPILFRPYLKQFLSKIYMDFELVIFTASKKDYADVVIDAIDPEGIFFSSRIYRESNIFIKHGIYVKDLRVVKNRHLKDCVIVDNNLLSFANQLSNGILVPSYFDNPNDNYLTCLLGYLMNELLNCDDVQKVNNESFAFENMKLEVLKI